MYATCPKLKHSRAESSVTHVVSSFRLLLNLRVAVTPGTALSSQSNLCNVMRTEVQHTAPLAEGERRSDLDKRAMWSGRNSTRDKLPVSSTAEFLVESRKFANVLNPATARQPCPVPRQLAWTAYGILHHVLDGTALHVVRAKGALLVSLCVCMSDAGAAAERCKSLLCRAGTSQRWSTMMLLKHESSRPLHDCASSASAALLLRSSAGKGTERPLRITFGKHCIDLTK